VIRRSTSAGLLRTDTGKQLPGSSGLHDYVPVRNGSDIERYLTTLHDRCWLAGLGWYMVGTAGQLLERSIIDRMVGGPERLVFEGPPILEPPLEQDAERRRPKVVEGEIIDTLAACPPLTADEQQQLDKLKAEAERRLRPERNKAKQTFIARQAKVLVERTGMTAAAAAAVIERQCEGVLLPEVELAFTDPELKGMTVADVLANPERFEGCALADPIEGVEYGRQTAKVLRRADGTPWINSFAHGRTVYELRPKDLPELVLNEQNPSDTAKRLAALIAARTDFLFNGNTPVRIATEPGHAPKAIEVTTGAIRHLAHSICIPIKIERAKAGMRIKKPVPLSIDLANLYLDLEGQWGLRPFRGITSAPILSDDGAIRTASGYDDATRLWCHNIPAVEIPEQPTREDADQALALLRYTFRTFPFADAERTLDPGLGVEIVKPGSSANLDESSHLAAILTAVCRQSLPLAPGLLCNAPGISGSRTGKGKLVRAICVIGSGVSPIHQRSQRGRVRQAPGVGPDRGRALPVPR
jgi:hypothetical protein